MEHVNALPTGTRLGEYEIHNVLGQGGFGITYLANDTHLAKRVALKEYLPRDFATRTTGSTVVPNSSADAADYRWGLERFLDEARTLARFDHPHLNKVYRFFEANGTAYLVLEYIDGQTLSHLLTKYPTVPDTHLRRIIHEVLSGLEEVHRAGYVHRDIKPSNLMLRGDGSTVLLDFGAARQAVGQRSKSLTAILTPGYAPVEQYDTKAADVGPWSDLYALGMVAYRCVSGVRDADLPDAVTRARSQRKGGQELAPAIEVGEGVYAARFLKAIDWAIRVNEEERPQSIAAWRKALPPLDSKEEPPPPGPGPKPPVSKVKRPKRPLSRWARGLVGGVAVIVAGVLFTTGSNISSVREIWDAFRPYSEEEILAFRSQGTRVEGRVKAAGRHMNKFRSQIEDDIRDTQFSIRQLKSDIGRASTSSEREAIEREIDELERKGENLRTQSDLLRDFVVESDQSANLSGRLTLAKSLLDDKEYQKAVAEYRAVDAGYETLVNALEPSALLSSHYNKTMQARAVWEQTKRESQYGGTIPLAHELNDLYRNGQDLLDKADFLAAVNVYEKLAADYSHLTRALTEGNQHRERAAGSKASWEAYANENTLETDYTSEYANLFAEAERLWNGGDIVPAGEHYELLHKEYGQLEDAARSSEEYGRNARAAQEEWREYAQRNNLSISLDAEYDGRYRSARAALQRGQLVDSAKEFAELSDAYSRLLSIAERMVSNASSAESLRRDWQSLIRIGWARERTGENADTLYDTAENQKSPGFYTKATSTYASASNTYKSLIRQAQDNRNRYEESQSNWENEIENLQSDIQRYTDLISRYNTDMDNHRRASNRECSEGGFMAALGEGLQAVNCELGCNRQVWNGSYYVSLTDQYCVSQCRAAQRVRMDRQHRAIQECRESRETAQQEYSRAEEGRESAENNLSRARNALERMRNSKPRFTPI